MNTKEKMIRSFLGNIEGWKSVLDSSPDLIAILDTEFKVTWINKAMARVLNVSSDSCLGLKCFEAVHGTQSPIPNCPHAKMMLDGHEYTEEVNEENLGGCFHVTASPIKDESGNVLGSVHIARNITERKKAEEKIQRLIDVVESSNDAIITNSIEGTILSWNKGAEQIYGYSAEEILGAPISLLEASDSSRETEKLINRIKNGEKIEHYETLRLRKDGTIINISISLSPVFDNSGELAAVSTIARDITERARAEKQKQILLGQLQQLNEELEASNEELQAANEELNVSNEELQDTTEELQAANEELQNTTEELQVANEELRQQGEDLVYLNRELLESEQRVRLKLESILSPEGNIGNLDLADIIDVQAVQSLMDNFYKLAGIPMAIIDLKGEVLIGVGWQDICTNFHRVHPETSKHCIESDTQLSAGVPAGEFKLYKCKNNMWDIATPIIVGGKHLGNLFSGQFFFGDEEVDYELFYKQAQKYNFNEEDYITSLEAVPRLSRESLDEGMAFFIKLADMISQMSYNNIKLARSLTERDNLMDSLRESEQRMNRSQEIGRIGSWELDLVNDHLLWSDEVYRIFGLQPQEFDATYEAFLEAIHPEDREAVDEAYSSSISEGRDTYEIEHRVVRKSTGEVRIVYEKCEHFRNESGEIIRSVGMVHDITERKKAEESILWNQQRNELLAEVSSRLLSSKNPQDIVDDLCQKTMEFLDCDVFFNYLVDGDKGCLHLNAYAGIPEEEAQKIEWLDYGEAVCGCAALESRRIIAENIMETPDPRTDLVKSYGVQAYACHPLMMEGLSIGTLSFGTNSRTKFTDEELELMKAVADQISIAMNRLISNRILKESEESAIRAKNEWEQTFEAVPDLIAILDTNYKVVRANNAMADKFGITPEECIGLTCYEVVHGMDEPPSFCPHQQLLEDGSEHTEEVHEDSLGGDFLVSASPLHDSEGKLIGSVHVARDINERKQKEKELHRLNRAYMALSNSSQAMIRAKNELEYLKDVCRVIVEDCGHSMVWIGYVGEDEGKSVRPVAYSGFEEGYLKTLNVTWEDSERGRGPTGTAIRTGKPSVCKNIITDPKFKPWREEAIKRGYASVISLPLMTDNRSFGAVNIYSREPDPFSQEEIKLLTKLGEDLVYGINAIRLQVAHEQAEEALIRSENEFRALAENSPDVISRFDRQNRHIYVNPASSEPYGRPQEEIIGKTHTELGMDPEKTEFWERHHEKVFITGKPEIMEFQYTSPKGEEYYYTTQIVPEFADGEVKSILAISRDITYIKEAEAELKKAHDNLEEQIKERTLELEKAYESLKLANDYNRSLIEASIDPLVTIGPDGKITDVNYSTEQVTGYSREEIIGTDFSDYFTEPEKARNGYKEVFREGWVFDYPLEIKHKNGHVTPVLYNASVYKDESGEVIGVFAAARDITEIKQAENEIKKQAELLNLTHEAIIVRDMDSKILFWNDGAEETYGWSMEEAKGKITCKLLKTIFPEPLEDILIHLMDKGQWEGELVHVKRDGTQITVLSRWALKRDENGNPNSILEINSDISERKKMEEELEFAGKYNRSLIETSLDPLVTIGPDGKITDVNGATEAVTGYSRGELIGTDFSDYFTEPEKAREGYKQVFRERWVFDYPLEIQHRNGHVTPVLYNASVYEDELGNVIGVFAAARDITELKRAETEKQKLLEQAQQIAEELEMSNEELQATTEELQASNEELRITTNDLQAANKDLEFASKYNRSLIETSLDPLVTIGPDGKVTDVNMATEIVTGCYRDEIVGTDFSNYFTEPKKARDGYQEVFRVGQVFDYPLKIKHKDGHVTPVLYNASVYRDDSGDVIGVFAAARDITERKKVEEELKLASIYNRSLIEASLDPLVTIGPDGKITDVNGATELVTGYYRDELIGTDFLDYFTEPEKAREGYQKVFREGKVFDYPLEIKNKDGHMTPVLYNASVYRDDSGDVIGVFAAARDITERKEAEKMLKLKLDELARSNAELEQFAYVSSHDLQEPLRMIGSYLQLLQRRYQGELDDKADKYIDFAVDGATRMQNLINDLLEFSRVTTRAREFESTDCELILDQVLSNLEISIKENEAVVSHDHLPTVMADSTQLVQVFQNLISNAIKFRSEKPPKIYISAEKDDDQWIFSVADNGIGIDPKHSERIFEVFKRLHKRKEYPGTGIGLSICKKIIERHGGHIWVESEPNNGSVFYFTLLEGVVNDKVNGS